MNFLRWHRTVQTTLNFLISLIVSLLNNCIFPEKSSSLFTVVLLQVLSYKNEPSTICYGTFTCSLCSSNCLVTVHASTLLSSGVVGRMFIYIGFNN